MPLKITRGCRQLVAAAEQEIETIGIVDALGLHGSDEVVFVDLRDTADFRAGHIVDAMHIPSSKLLNNTGLLENYREKPIVLVCKMGQSSGAVGKKLNAVRMPRDSGS